MAVLVLVSALVLFACAGGTGKRRTLSAPVDLTSANIIALEGSFPPQFTIPDGTVTISDGSSPPFTIPAGLIFSVATPPGDICKQPASQSAQPQPVTLTFAASSGNPSTLFILSRFGSMAIASGGVTFGSCILTATTSSFSAGQGPQTGDTITFSTCQVVVNATNVEVGGDPETGTITLMLTRTITNAAGVTICSISAASTPLSLFSAVAIRSDGFLLLNDVNMGINTNITGTVSQ
jgi:hypothetical protein